MTIFEKLPQIFLIALPDSQIWFRPSEIEPTKFWCTVLLKILMQVFYLRSPQMFVGLFFTGRNETSLFVEALQLVGIFQECFKINKNLKNC